MFSCTCGQRVQNFLTTILTFRSTKLILAFNQKYLEQNTTAVI